jgi:hypothetical protein
MDNVLCPGEAAKWSIRMGVDDGFTLPQLGVGSRGAVVRNMSERTIFVQRHGAEVRLAYAGRVFQHRPEYRLQFARRTADDLENLRGRGLLLQGFAKFVKQPRVLDGDDGLRCEVLDQLDLLVGERPNFLAVNSNHANELVLFKHRHDQKSPGASQSSDPLIRIFHSEVGNVDDLLGVGDAVKDGGRVTRNNGIALRPVGGVGRRGVMQRSASEHIALVEQQGAETGLADAHRILKHGLEYRVQFTRRTADHLKYIRRSSLLLQRLT